MTQDPHGWSDDMVWGVSVADTPVLLLAPDGRVAHANRCAHELAERLHLAHPARFAPDPAGLLDHVPAPGWDHARQHQLWVGEVAIDDATGPTLLEIKLFCGTAQGATRRFVVMTDESARSARENELKARHDKLERTYRHLAETQEQLLQSEKMASIGQLAAGVAHEINNPIGYVHSNLGTLSEYVASMLSLLDAYNSAMQLSDPGAAREQLAAMRERLDMDFIAGDVPQLLVESREGIERVTKIVQDLKDFSHAGRDEAMRPSDLIKGLESTLNIVWNELKYKVRLEKHYELLPPVECHPSEINQVLMNLLINAGQAIGERGTIVLACGVEPGDDEVWISVTDSGSGIAEDALARIFDPFYTTKPIGRGTGLGLAIAYSIINKHHGRIEVDSRVGQGSTFRVVLPITQPASAGGDGADAMREPGMLG